jgi:hypothetical protein
MYQPLSTDLKKMEKQCQDVDVVRFLLGLKPSMSLFVCRFWVVSTSHCFLRFSLCFSVPPSLIMVPC